MINQVSRISASICTTDPSSLLGHEPPLTPQLMVTSHTRLKARIAGKWTLPPKRKIISGIKKGNRHKSQGFELWERRNDITVSSHKIPSQITDLELILQSLKLVRSVGKAKVSLTAEAEKDQNMRGVARECQDAMMSSGS